MIADIKRFLRDAEWANSKRLRGYFGLLALANLAGLAALASYAPAGVDPRGEPLGTDFVSFWTAGRMALSGHAAAIYSPQAHLAAERALFGHPIDWYAFFYPPIFVLFCLPLGALPYLGALAAWLALSFAAMLTALRALAPRFAHPLVVLAFPGVLATAGHGQNAFLTTALFAGGASLLERRPLLAGALFGALIFKPQLAAAIPLGLLLAGRYRALAGMAASGAALAAASLIAFGWETWAAFLAETPLTRATLERGLVEFAKMPSVYAGLRELGAGSPLAYAAQGLAALAAFAGLAWTLRRERDARRQCAAIVAATCLSTPFLLDYDLTLLIVPIAVIAEAGLTRGFRPYEISAAVAAFLAPGFVRPLAHYAHLPVGPLVVAALFFVLLRRAPAPAAAICRRDPVAA
ncbi:MAG: DUF2029 domain-containing protein [Pseudomonadota bacterium]|nr:DUF2029 domain-containing protein [Pseudomonadota bacterium]